MNIYNKIKWPLNRGKLPKFGGFVLSFKSTNTFVRKLLKLEDFDAVILLHTFSHNL